MQVSLQYAQEHFSELIDAADNGQDVEITRPQKPAVKLVVPFQAQHGLKDGKRVLGAGVGLLQAPTWEEWKAMDAEMEREMCNAPLTSTGEI